MTAVEPQPVTEPRKKPPREQPWAVRGVSREAREAAAFAARRSGLTLGQWVDQAILRTMREEVAGPGRGDLAEAFKEATATLARTNERLDTLIRERGVGAETASPKRHLSRLFGRGG